MRTLLAFLIWLGLGMPATACELDDLIGWTLIARKTIVAWIEQGVRQDGFQGCRYDRIIVFQDNTGVRCRTYNYMYAYRPTAHIWGDGSSLKLCVQSSLFDVSPLR